MKTDLAHVPGMGITVWESYTQINTHKPTSPFPSLQSSRISLFLPAVSLDEIAMGFCYLICIHSPFHCMKVIFKLLFTTGRHMHPVAVTHKSGLAAFLNVLNSRPSRLCKEKEPILIEKIIFSERNQTQF